MSLRKIYTRFFFCLMISLTGIMQAQENFTCADKVALARKYTIGAEILPQDGVRALEMIQECVQNGDPDALHTAGLILYGANSAVKPDYKKAFDFVKAAAEQDHSEAACNLAISYQMGKGCKLDFDKAREWYEKSYALGSGKAAFKLGYLYFKGLGNIDQDYVKAQEWFEKSDHPMAEYFLGLQYYFGYGVAVNQQKSKEILLGSVGTNTYILGTFLSQGSVPKIQPKDLVEVSSIHNEVAVINPIAEGQETITAENQNDIAQDVLQGKWAGYLIELDWSKSKLLRSLQVEVGFSKDEGVGSLDYDFIIDGKSTKNFGILLGNEYYFEKLSIQLPRMYQDAHPFTSLDYDITAAGLKINKLGGQTYLTATLDTHLQQWNEPGTPMRLVLVKQTGVTSNGREISQELLEALAATTDEGFITLYPNPFISDLLVEYELEETSTVTVELYGYTGDNRRVIEPGVTQAAGKYVYHLDGSAIPQGLYIVRVMANGQAHTKLIVKN